MLSVLYPFGCPCLIGLSSRADSDLMELSSTSKASDQSEDDLDQLQRDVLGFLPAEEEREEAEPEALIDGANASDPEDSGSLDSSYRVDPSGTTL